MLKQKFFFAVSFIAMLAAGVAHANTASGDAVGTAHTVYTAANNKGSSTVTDASSGIAGVTYVNRMVNVAGNAAQQAENHAASAGASALSAAAAAAEAKDSAAAAEGVVAGALEKAENAVSTANTAKGTAEEALQAATNATDSAAASAAAAAESASAAAASATSASGSASTATSKATAAANSATAASTSEKNAKTSETNAATSAAAAAASATSAETAWNKFSNNAGTVGTFAKPVYMDSGKLTQVTSIDSSLLPIAKDKDTVATNGGDSVVPSVTRTQSMISNSISDAIAGVVALEQGKDANSNKVMITNGDGTVTPVSITTSGNGTLVTDVSVADGKLTVNKGSSLPTVNNATLTIKNGATNANLATFTANSSTAATATIPAATPSVAGLAKYGQIPSGSATSTTYATIWVE